MEPMRYQGTIPVIVLSLFTVNVAFPGHGSGAATIPGHGTGAAAIAGHVTGSGVFVGYR